MRGNGKSIVVKGETENLYPIKIGRALAHFFVQFKNLQDPLFHQQICSAGIVFQSTCAITLCSGIKMLTQGNSKCTLLTKLWNV